MGVSATFSVRYNESREKSTVSLRTFVTGVNPKHVDILMGTFTKSFGAAGGYIAADKVCWSSPCSLICFLSHKILGRDRSFTASEPFILLC